MGPEYVLLLGAGAVVLGILLAAGCAALGWYARDAVADARADLAADQLADALDDLRAVNEALAEEHELRRAGDRHAAEAAARAGVARAALAAGSLDATLRLLRPGSRPAPAKPRAPVPAAGPGGGPREAGPDRGGGPT